MGRGFPGGTSGKEPTCQCRRYKSHGFDPWVRKIPWRRAGQSTPVFLPGESPWTEESCRLQFMGLQRAGHSWAHRHPHKGWTYDFEMFMIFIIVCGKLLPRRQNTLCISWSHTVESLLSLSKTSVQFSSVAQLCPTLCYPMDCSTPGLPVHHQLPEFTQTHVHWIGKT